MFSAFSSIDYHSIRANTPAEMAIKRLTGIGEVLSGIDISAIHTQDDMARALLTLDTADKCIRTILTEFRTENLSRPLPYALYVRIRPWKDRRSQNQRCHVASLALLPSRSETGSLPLLVPR